MAITTKLSLSSDGNGGVVLVQGTLEGAQGRAVTIQATPAPGYQFERWEVQTFPVELQTFAVVASQPVATVREVCGTLNTTRQYDGYTQYSSTYQNVARELFTDGTTLYLDTEGRTPAPTGYWGAGGGTYYYWTGGRLPQLQMCTYEGGSGGGTSETGPMDTGLGGTTSWTTYQGTTSVSTTSTTDGGGSNTGPVRDPSTIPTNQFFV